MSAEIRTGQDRPLLHPVAPQLEQEISDLVEAEPGVELLMLGRSNTRYQRIVGAILLESQPVREAFIEEIRETIRRDLGNRVTIHIDILKKGTVLRDKGEE